MRIALLGVFGVNNFGNEASLASVVSSIRHRLPSAELFCVCSRPAKVTEAHQLEAFDMSLTACGPCTGVRRVFLALAVRTGLLRAVRAMQAYRLMRDVDALVVPGTGILDDFGLSPSGLPVDLLVWCSLARLRGAHVVFVSVGAGPIRNRRTLRLMRTAARMATHRSYRDAASRSFMASNRVDVSDDPVVPDVVFSLNPETTASPSEKNADSLVVALGVMSYRGWNALETPEEDAYRKHVEDTEKIIRHVLDCGHRLKLILGEPGDQEVVEDLLARLRDADSRYKGRYSAPQLSDFGDLLRELSSSDVVIATRFHNVLCALVMGKPVISIGYANKNRDLLAEFGLAEYAHDIETLSVDRLIGQFDEITGRLDELKEPIANKVRQCRAEIDAHMESLWQMLEAKSSAGQRT